jgi:hypothetical protein
MEIGIFMYDRGVPNDLEGFSADIAIDAKQP